jgi:hypothetical protein
MAVRMVTIALLFLTVSVGAVCAEEEKRYVFVGFDGGFSWALGEGSDLWEKGATAGLNLFYPLTSYLFLGGRAAFGRWTLNRCQAAQALIPPGATVLSTESDGEFSIFELTPVVRLSKDRFVWERLAGFVQLGGGLYYIKFDAASIVQYSAGGTSRTVEAASDGSDYRGGLNVGAGLSFTVSKDSRLDIYPVYNVIFEEGDTTEYISLLFAFRVEFSPWKEP